MSCQSLPLWVSAVGRGTHPVNTGWLRAPWTCSPEGITDNRELTEYFKSQMKEDPGMASAVVARVLEARQRGDNAGPERESHQSHRNLVWPGLLVAVSWGLEGTGASSALPPWNTLISPNVKWSWLSKESFFLGEYHCSEVKLQICAILSLKTR